MKIIRWNSTRSDLLSSAFIALVIFGCQCPESYVRAKQICTFADMQVISSKIAEAWPEDGGVLKDREARRIVASVNSGLDSWGNSIVYVPVGEGEELNFLLISYGADGRPDVEDYSEYLDLREAKDIRGEEEHDIVFRGNMPMTLAGK